jgi:ATP-binding cassette subfamily B protein
MNALNSPPRALNNQKSLSSSQVDFNMKQILTGNRFLGLWRLLSGYRLSYAIATISIGLATLATTASYYVLRYAVDQVLLKDQLMTLLPWIAAGFVGLALVQGGFTFLSGRLAAQTSEGVALRLRNYLYDHLQRLSFTYHDNMQTGELLQRATSDVDALRRLFAEQIIGIGRVSLLFWVNFIALLNLNVSLALFSVMVIPVVLAISLFFFKKIGEAYEAYQEQDAVVSTRLQENLTGVRVVKAFARQDYERDKFERENWKKFLRGRRLITMHSTYWPVTDILCGLQMLAGFYLGARMAIDGSITPGTYLAYAGLVIQIIWPIRNLGRLVAQMSTGLVSFDRVSQIIRVDREPLDEGDFLPEDGVKGEIRFEHVDFAYETEKPAGVPQQLSKEDADPLAFARKPVPVLHDITFEAKPGQVIGLLGSTGSGKTSLVNLLPRFYEYTGGRITLDGVELREYPRSYLRRQIGIVQQEPFLFSRSIRDNITYGVGRDVSDEEVAQAARAAAIHDVILSFPEGYNTLVGERGVTLSGGQKQRLTLARTLLKNPRILVLDDATSSVDTETDAAIRNALKQLMADRTTFVIAHRVQSVMDADLILVLDEGRIVQRGTHEELVAQPGIYRQVYDLQARIEDELEKELAGALQESEPAPITDEDERTPYATSVATD